VFWLQCLGFKINDKGRGVGNERPIFLNLGYEGGTGVFSPAELEIGRFGAVWGVL